MATRTLTIEFTGKTKGLDDASRRGKAELDGWKGTFKKWNQRAVVASTAVIAGAVKVGKSLIDAGREGIATDKALAQVFESMQGTGSAAFRQVGDAQDDMTRRLGRSKTEIAAVQTQLGTFKGVWDDPVAGAENFNRATELAFDLEAAGFGSAEGNVKQLGRAINDPIQGMTALTRAGVSFTQAEKDKIKELQESGDLLGAQEMIYAALEEQVGGVAEATTDGGDRMRASWENFQDTIGRKLIPVFEQLMAVGLQVIEWAEQNSDTLLRVGAVVVGLAAFVLAANAAWKVYIATKKAVILVTKAFTAAQRALNLAMRANPIGIVITVLALLVTGIVAAYRKSETFRNIVNGVWNSIKSTVSTVWNNVLKPVLKWFQDLPGKIRSAMSTVASAISSPFRTAFDGIKVLWNNTLGKVSFSIPSWVPGVGGKGWSFPKMHSGGIFMPEGGASQGLALLRRGERVLTPGQDERRGGDTYVTVQAWSDRFSLPQVMRELRHQGVA